MARVLVVEDEPAIAELIAIHLRHAGYEYACVDTAEAALDEVHRRLPDAIVLDWMLPGTSGVQLAQTWRRDVRTRELPILMLTARADENDKVRGLDAGADDYLTKPFSPKELLARIRAVLRRKAPQLSESSVQVGTLCLDPLAHKVSADDKPIKLGPTEFKLLHYLMTHLDRVHSRSHLLDRVWGDHVEIEERTVDVHIKRLREALSEVQCAHLIETVRGSGYRMSATASSP